MGHLHPLHLQNSHMKTSITCPYWHLHYVQSENGKRCIFRIKALRVPVIDFLLRCALCSFQEARLSCLLHLLHTKDFFFFCPSSSLRNVLLGITQMQRATAHSKCLGPSSSWMEPPQAACHVSKGKKAFSAPVFLSLLGIAGTPGQWGWFSIIKRS